MDQFQEFLTDMDEYKRRLKRFEKRSSEYEAKVKQTARDTYLGSLFVMNFDMDQYGDLLRHWETEFLGGKIMYPSSLQDAITRLENYKRTNKKKNGSKPNRTQMFPFCNPERLSRAPTESCMPKSIVTSARNSATTLFSVLQTLCLECRPRGFS